MKTSNEGIGLIKAFEGLRLQSYQCPAGKWTIGYGTTKINAVDVSSGMIISQDDAEHLLRQDLIQFEKKVLDNIEIPLRQHQFDALVSHTYNTGGSETLFALINAGFPSEIIRNWMETSHITGNKIVLNGLVRRRKAEADLFFTEI
jgi:lysozyme